jgi:hypothetical protein
VLRDFDLRFLRANHNSQRRLPASYRISPYAICPTTRDAIVAFRSGEHSDFIRLGTMISKIRIPATVIGKHSALPIITHPLKFRIDNDGAHCKV